MTRKFKLEWINVPGVELGHSEIQEQEELRDDFSHDKRIVRFINQSKKGDAFIVFDMSDQGFLLITRTSNYAKSTSN
jgi:hypothetical protein